MVPGWVRERLLGWGGGGVGVGGGGGERGGEGGGKGVPEVGWRKRRELKDGWEEGRYKRERFLKGSWCPAGCSTFLLKHAFIPLTLYHRLLPLSATFCRLPTVFSSAWFKVPTDRAPSSTIKKSDLSILYCHEHHDDQEQTRRVRK